MAKRYDITQYTGGGRRDAWRVDGSPASESYARGLLRCASRLESLSTQSRGGDRFAHFATAVFDGHTDIHKKES